MGMTPFWRVVEVCSLAMEEERWGGGVGNSWGIFDDGELGVEIGTVIGDGVG